MESINVLPGAFRPCRSVVFSLLVSIGIGTVENPSLAAVLPYSAARTGAERPAPSTSQDEVALSDAARAASTADVRDRFADDLTAPSLEIFSKELRDAFQSATREGWCEEALIWYFLATTAPGSRSPAVVDIMVSARFGDRLHEGPPVWALQAILRESQTRRHSRRLSEMTECESDRLAVTYDQARLGFCDCRVCGRPVGNIVAGRGDLRGAPSRDDFAARRSELRVALITPDFRHHLRSWVVNDTGFFRQLGVVGLGELGGLLPSEVHQLIPLIVRDDELRYLVAQHMLELVPESLHRTIIETLASVADDCAHRAAASGLAVAGSRSAAADALERFAVLRSPQFTEDVMLASRLRLIAGESGAALDALFDWLDVTVASDDLSWTVPELPALVLDWAMLGGEQVGARFDRMLGLATKLHAESRHEACAVFALAGCLVDPAHASLRAMVLSSLTADELQMLHTCKWRLACAVSAVPNLADELDAVAKAGADRTSPFTRSHPVWAVLGVLFESVPADRQ